MVRVDPYKADSSLSEVRTREHLPRQASPQREEVERERDPFFNLNLEQLEQRQEDWGAERSAHWADIRLDVADEDVLAVAA